MWGDLMVAKWLVARLRGGEMTAIRCLHDTGVIFILVRVHSGSHLWLSICLHCTGSVAVPVRTLPKLITEELRAEKPKWLLRPNISYLEKLDFSVFIKKAQKSLFSCGALQIQSEIFFTKSCHIRKQN